MKPADMIHIQYIFVLLLLFVSVPSIFFITNAMKTYVSVSASTKKYESW